MNLIVYDDQSNIIKIGSELANRLGFTSDKFDGYLWDDGNGCIILSLIISLYPGKGNFREFMHTLKSRYDRIVVPSPSNRMRSICKMLGFKDSYINDESNIPAMIYETSLQTS